MAKYTVRIYTKNGDKVEIDTDDMGEVQKLERLPFDKASNIGSAHITVND